MSGPIVRKYGFPNFEKIFGERGLQHGADEPETGAPSPEGAKTTAPADAPAAEEPVSPKEGKKG